jgi:hypothetical protein
METHICFFILVGSAAIPPLFFSQFLFALETEEKFGKICFFYVFFLK